MNVEKHLDIFLFELDQTDQAENCGTRTEAQHKPSLCMLRVLSLIRSSLLKVGFLRLTTLNVRKHIEPLARKRHFRSGESVSFEPSSHTWIIFMSLHKCLMEFKSLIGHLNLFIVES